MELDNKPAKDEKISDFAEVKENGNAEMVSPKSELNHPEDQINNRSSLVEDGDDVVDGNFQPVPVVVGGCVGTSTPTSIPIPVLHVNASPLSSRSSSEELWTPRSLLEDTQDRNEKMLASLTMSHELLNQLRCERAELEKDLRVFSESIPLMSDECVSSLRQRMSRRIATMESSFNSFTEGRSKNRRQMKSLIEDGWYNFL